MNDIVQQKGEEQIAVEWAPAKINLWLKIHGRKADGYHDLSTVMLALDLCDRLSGSCTATNSIALSLSGPHASGDIPCDENNLVWRALDSVRGWASDSGRVDLPGVEVVLAKQIPSQAGLGGGSSDAAAALRLGERLYGVDPGPVWRATTLAGLGADCSFFGLVGGSGLALCEGRGERVTPWPGRVPAWAVVLLVPDIACPTGQIFGALSRVQRRAFAQPFQANELQELSSAELNERLVTDLEAAALEAVPELCAWRELLDGEGAGEFRLSGSGSAFFGLFEETKKAHAKLDQLVRAAGQKGLKLRANLVTTARRRRDV